MCCEGISPLREAHVVSCTPRIFLMASGMLQIGMILRWWKAVVAQCDGVISSCHASEETAFGPLGEA